MKEIRFTTTKTGKARAYSFNRSMQRWFPMPLADAQLQVATGAAQDVTEQHAAAIATYGVYL